MEFSRRHMTMQDLSTTATAEILPFCSNRNGLRLHEVDALTAMTADLDIPLICETERDGAGDLWAIIGPRDPELSGYTAFLVCRKGARLALIEAPVAASWTPLGNYGTIRAVGGAIKQRLSTHRHQ